MIPNLKSNEGRALAMILTVLGEHGRGVIRGHLLKHVIDDNYEGGEPKITLDVMNAFERAFDQLEQEKRKKL